MELSPVEGISLTLNTVVTGPAGFTTSNTAQPVMGNTTTYTSIAMVNSFGRDQSGNYTCTATVSAMPSNLFLVDGVSSGIARVSVGEDICASTYEYDVEYFHQRHITDFQIYITEFPYMYMCEFAIVHCMH